LTPAWTRFRTARRGFPKQGKNRIIRIVTTLGYALTDSGKTGGSRVVFSNGDGDYIRLHKPHPRNTLKPYQVNDIISLLTEMGLL
jgi:hypothetical protein